KIEAIDISPDDQTLASASRDGTVRLWDVRTEQSLQVLHEHVDRVWSAHFSADASLLATAGKDSKVLIWRLPARKDHRHFATGSWLQTAISSDGQAIAGIDPNGALELMDLEGRRNRPSIPVSDPSITSLALTGHGGALAIGNRQGRITLWRLAEKSSQV